MPKTYLRAIIVQVAWAASRRTKGSFFKEKFTKLVIRKSRKKALVTIGRKILVVVWHILKENTQYNPNLVRFYDSKQLEQKIKYHEREIERTKKLMVC